MSEIVFFLEEPSAEAMLEGFLPKALPAGPSYRCIVFEGKQDLEKQLVKRMRGYRVPHSGFVVLRDQDSGDCKKIKSIFVQKCNEAKHPDALIRIACYELESWYLADLCAVEKAFSLSGFIKKYQNKMKFRSPDEFPSPAKTLKNIVPLYQKVSGSRAIGPHIDPNNSRSRSFYSFVSGLRKLCELSVSKNKEKVQ